MSGPALVKLALDTLSCSQKDLAAKIGVSPTQISKWKAGEYVSFEMEGKLRKITKVGEVDPDLVVWAGSLENTRSWESAIRYLADIAADNSETGYHTLPLEDDLGLLCTETIMTLLEMGVTVPKVPPVDLSAKTQTEEEDEALIEAVEDHYVFQLISKLYGSLNDVWGFYAAFIDDLINEDDLGLIGTEADNIEPALLRLAATKLDLDLEIAPNFQTFQHSMKRDYTKWLTLVKRKSFQSGIPLKAELLDLVYCSHDELGLKAEEECLNFNNGRLHPDIYMNEVLVGMRILHQVLPAIMSKLDMKDEFELDESNLRLGG